MDSSPSPHVSAVISNRYVPMKPMISHASLDKDFFSCFVLLVLKAGFPAHTCLVAWVQAVSVARWRTLQRPATNKIPLCWICRPRLGLAGAVFVDLRLAGAKSVGIWLVCAEIVGMRTNQMCMCWNCRWAAGASGNTGRGGGIICMVRDTKVTILDSEFMRKWKTLLN